MTSIAVAVWLSTSLFPLRLEGQNLPRVHLIATGGTIANSRTGRLTSDELSAEVPGVELVAAVTHEQFSNVPSAGLTLGHWLDLSKRINQLLSSDRALQGIVVTSGTDTLEETAFFLHLTVRDDRPVVVVGAMRRPHWVGYDGPANLLEAVRVAALPASRGRGVLVVMNDEINSARDVVKTDANRLQTFRSGNHGLLGVVDRDRIVFFRDVSQRHTGRSEFDISGLKELPSVEIIFVYQGASGHLIRAAVDGGAKAIVFAGAGAGALAITQVDAVDYALDKGVILIRGSRTGSGRVFRSEPSADATPAQLRRRAAMIPAEDHAPVKARILAMLALTKTSNREEIERIFREY